MMVIRISVEEDTDRHEETWDAQLEMKLAGCTNTRPMIYNEREIKTVTGIPGTDGRNVRPQSIDERVMK